MKDSDYDSMKSKCYFSLIIFTQTAETQVENAVAMFMSFNVFTRFLKKSEGTSTVPAYLNEVHLMLPSPSKILYILCRNVVMMVVRVCVGLNMCRVRINSVQ